MAQCLKPFFVKDGNGKQVLIPCGKCPKCRARKVSAWSFRLLQEDKVSKSAYFITLTYNDENLPITRNGYPTLRKRDLQLFFKRLRKGSAKKSRVYKRPIKYYAVGEYGGKIGRPHYHIILFNADVSKIQDAWSNYKWVYSGSKYKRRSKNSYPTINKKWRRKVWNHMGHVHYGNQKQGVSGASVGYTLKYMLKDKDHTRLKHDDSRPPFAVMSKGLGKDYLTPAMCRWHRDDLNHRMYVNLELRKKASMPRYYKDKIYTAKEREQIAQYSRDSLTTKILEDLFSLYKSDPDYVKTYQQKKRNQDQAVEAAYYKQKTKSKIYA